MHGNIGDERSSPMPPALTQRGDGRGKRSGDGRLAPPFVAGATLPAGGEPSKGKPISAASPDESLPWESPAEGTVQPAFEADTDAALAELSHQAHREQFPLDAFIVPEETKRLPAGMEGQAVPVGPEPSQVTGLADRLEKLSHRLRVEETDALLRKLARGDRLDALLAGLLAGFLAGSSDKD